MFQARRQDQLAPMRIHDRMVVEEKEEEDLRE
jgi:hypothetical protein